MKSCTAGELAERLGVSLSGDPATRLEGVATLQNAGPGDLTFLANPGYRKHLAETRAGAVILDAENAAACPGAALVSENPYVTYARAAGFFDPSRDTKAGIHPSAVVDPTAQVHADAEVGPLCVIGAGARIGAGSAIGAGCVIGDHVRIGAGCRLHARVTVGDRVVVGDRVIVHPGAVLGSDGFGLAFDEDHWIKVPQLGSVRIGDDCEIGANTSIDRGAVEDTILEEDVRLDNQIQIAHNVFIGAHTAMAGCSAVAGSARIGRYCLIGGGAGILGHLEVADRVTITAMSLVTHSIREPGEYSSGTPLQPNRQWRRNAVRLRQLDQLARTINELKRDRSND
ncbi:MAG: UDP-3-O-(3-hydroxymyristoyl)glucosamine N-acyltransferase [Xanthomonadales bacterium]|nr:UDP-3-O-(3-hydroxymyristoyl)glucosamine N-acyltransferase [Xanthomonadales bacterium]